ncbi:ABC transporter permease [Ancylobacter pratisalsi]|uniref:ABC transporter permease n=1 Tax=Ancylobacter pratisalsi TaxID=1745854 RepID=A0A6P1YUD4_9HYPH|nr:ABC transporter permease [Ancylobacter pratisalsi]QIB35224.1 ABC transporter permease [Ancylobacter pratisalsi]
MNKRLADALFEAAYLSLITLFIAFSVIPVLVALVLSFDARGFIGPFPPTQFSLRWYERFLADDYYHAGLVTSLIVAITATLIATFAGTLAAIALSRATFRGRGALQAALLSPLVVPNVVLGFGMLIFAARLGIVDGMTRLIMGHVLITFPYVMRTTAASLVGIKASYYEAALSLGARPWKAIAQVTLPLARTGILAGAVFGFVTSFDDVGISLFLTDAFTYTLPVAILAQMRANLDLTIAALSVIFILATVLLIVLLDRLAGLDAVVGRGVYGR